MFCFCFRVVLAGDLGAVTGAIGGHRGVPGRHYALDYARIVGSVG